MHIEPGVVNGAKLALSYATAAGAAVYAGREALKTISTRGALSFVARSFIATIGTFVFFEILPHFAVGVSEVHLILGSTLFLMLGVGPAGVGLALGLLIQGMFFAPQDLPQFFMNVTTLLVPLFALQAVAKRTIAKDTAYVDLGYAQALKLSVAYQGGVVAWVAFWVIWGQGFAAMAEIMTFGAAYMTVVLLEPLVDLAVLGIAKSLKGLKGSGLVEERLHNAA